MSVASQKLKMILLLLNTGNRRLCNAAKTRYIVDTLEGSSVKACLSDFCLAHSLSHKQIDCMYSLNCA